VHFVKPLDRLFDLSRLKCHLASWSGVELLVFSIASIFNDCLFDDPKDDNKSKGDEGSHRTVCADGWQALQDAVDQEE